jgi:hypothetical protein
MRRAQTRNRGSPAGVGDPDLGAEQSINAKPAYPAVPVQMSHLDPSFQRALGLVLK